MLIEKKSHLTEKNLFELIYYKSALNKGLSEDLKLAFPTISSLERPVYSVPLTPLNPYWVSGFIDGDGSFTVTIDLKANYVNIRIIVGLNHRESPLIQKILEFFGGVGNVSKPNKRSTVEFRVSTQKDLETIILPHFEKYPLISKKHLDFLYFGVKDDRNCFAYIKQKTQ